MNCSCVGQQIVIFSVRFGGQACPVFFGWNDDFECPAEIEDGAREYLVGSVRETGQAGYALRLSGEPLANGLVDQIGGTGIQAAMAGYGNAGHRFPSQQSRTELLIEVPDMAGTRARVAAAETPSLFDHALGGVGNAGL